MADRNDAEERRAATKRYAALHDEELLCALKREESGAFVEIVARYQGLVFKYARYFGVDSAEQREWVTDLLHDVVLSLMKPGAIVPTSFGSYIARACRNKAYMAHRAASRRKSHDPELKDELTPQESAEADPAITHFVGALSESLSPDDRQLLDWTSESVPLRVIAEWLGITRSGAAHKVGRLRVRLQGSVPEIISRLSPNEQRNVARLLRRAGRGVSNG